MRIAYIGITLDVFLIYCRFNKFCRCAILGGLGLFASHLPCIMGELAVEGSVAVGVRVIPCEKSEKNMTDFFLVFDFKSQKYKVF